MIAYCGGIFVILFLDLWLEDSLILGQRRGASLCDSMVDEILKRYME